MKNSISLIVTCLLVSQLAAAQPKYRTFSQFDLASKKTDQGKVIGSIVTFTFPNDEVSFPVNSLHVRLNANLSAISDSGGFSAISQERKKVLVFTGQTVAAGGAVSITLTLSKKEHGAKVDFWWWDTNGTKVGSKREHLTASLDSLIRREPNGGNAREFIYKHIVRRPAGITLGIPNTDHLGWIRYTEGDRKFFPHTDSARCFDFISHDGVMRPFTSKLRNPHVKKHDNHLLGELHALKLAIIANDSSFTEPVDSLSTALGDLVYNDPANAGDPFNAMTLRQIAVHADSTLTNCGMYPASHYGDLDSTVSRINRAFDGPYVAGSYHPLFLRGTHSLAEVPFLHPNPSIAVTIRPSMTYSAADDLPDAFSLRQNFPNPFNPSTTIEFVLAEPSLVSLSVYNILGQEVYRMIDRKELEDGFQSAEFDGTKLGSGVYYYRLTAEGLGGGSQRFVMTKRMLLVK